VSRGLYEYCVRESPRAKPIGLKVSLQNGLEVIIPVGFDRKLIPEILKKKKRWIRAAQGKIERQAKFVIHDSEAILPDYISLPSIGENWNLQYRIGKAEWAVVYEDGNGQLLIRGNIRDKTACKAALKRWLSRKARATLIPWLQEVGADNSLKFNRVFVKCQRTRWASCSRHKAISLNLKLLFLPMHLVRYVFIHELCHTIHMNHSQKYWAFLASREPEYVSLDKELRGAWRVVPPWVG